MVNIPKLKKKVHSFLIKEEGKISKENLIKTGALIAVFSIGAALSAQETEAAYWDVWCHKSNPSEAVTCSPDCEDVNDPNFSRSKLEAEDGETRKCDVTINGHQNERSLSVSGATATGTHAHCAQSCHVSHDSHSDHESGNWFNIPDCP